MDTSDAAESLAQLELVLRQAHADATDGDELISQAQIATVLAEARVSNLFLGLSQALPSAARVMAKGDTDLRGVLSVDQFCSGCLIPMRDALARR
eukprot:3060292-Prymnesium_polylepis.1